MKDKLNSIVKKVITLLLKKKKKDPFQHDPEADWEKILISFTIVFIVIIIANAIFFYMLNAGDLFQAEAPTTTTAQLFNKNLLKDTNDYYDTREAHLNSIQASSTPVIDPSL